MCYAIMLSILSLPAPFRVIDREALGRFVASETLLEDHVQRSGRQPNPFLIAERKHHPLDLDCLLHEIARPHWQTIP
jgi:hypothetical protein